MLGDKMQENAPHEYFEYLTNPSVVFYHGSRGGLIGDISPISRPGTDFGRGFYAGNLAMQAKSLVIYDQQPVAYSLQIDFSGIREEDVKFLDYKEWVYTVLCNRRNCKMFNGTWLDDLTTERTAGYEFIVGPTADDRMNEAVRLFSENALTDEGLAACLATAPYGIQIVAKTEAACRRIKVIAEQPIYETEAEGIREYRRKLHAEAKTKCREIQIAYKGKGKYLSEILSEGPANAADDRTKRKVLAFSEPNAIPPKYKWPTTALDVPPRRASR